MLFLQKAGSVSDLLSTMKLLCLNFWVEDVKEVDDLRLDIALRMLKSPHFNAKINSLKEVHLFGYRIRCFFKSAFHNRKKSQCACYFKGFNIGNCSIFKLIDAPACIMQINMWLCALVFSKTCIYICLHFDPYFSWLNRSPNWLKTPRREAIAMPSKKTSSSIGWLKRRFFL